MIFSSDCQSIQMIYMTKMMNALMRDQKQKVISYLKQISLEPFHRTKDKYSNYQKIWQEINYKNNQH